ncbi:dmX-like protein 2 [Centruroides sculpturatus]|uniref:dmX-like protein 2 n=1 Tax=Centruroides sculpturatus TaxID=218467 RepID=UPI000C6CC25D|nr:dmX-like protein 2 [Centruroides sculpturatus]
MNCHQILTGAVNSGDHCSEVGSVQGIPFTAYAAGCNIVILASDFQRIQIIPGICHGNVQVGCLDCSTDLGKIAAAYGRQICIYEPTPLLNENSSHRLDYRWVQTATFESDCYIHVLSWNQDGSKLLTAGEYIQMWHLSTQTEDVIQEEINFQVNDSDQPTFDFEEQSKWNCIWKCKTAQPVNLLKFSPDGSLFASVGKTDRLVKVWYESRKGMFTSQMVRSSSILNDVSYTFIYLAHPRAVTGFSWRKTSKYMPRESVANMLITSCRDNTCRLWVQTLLTEEGKTDIQHTETVTANNSKRQSHRHRRGIMQQLKHIKSFSQYKRRQASQFTEDKHETIPTLPSTYSVHDFHSFGLHGSNITPGVHFHLAASINAETDIPLVPTMLGISSNTEPNFVLHWLNNKEMTFTVAAEQLIQEISQKVLNGDVDIADNGHSDAETFPDNVKHIYYKNNKNKMKSSKLDCQESFDDDISKQSGSGGSSSASLATDATQSNIQLPSGDTLERKFDMLIRNWHQNPDILFSIHPIDGSLLVWFVYYLDEYNAGTFRQAQVNFSLRKVNVIPLFDAATMSHQIHIYLPHCKLNLCPTKTSSAKDTEKSNSVEHTLHEESNDFEMDSKDIVKSSSVSIVQNQPTPTVCMISKHNNGSFNLWHLTFGENSSFTQVLTISHAARVCGHRFRINDITCHPVLPLLLTTSHHNLPGQSSVPVSLENQPAGSCCFSSSLPSGFCSELILWKVDAVGPLSKSGGITELARLNSPKISAFANVAWIPTLLPSTTLGGISNSPSACFVASDGHQLRVYQAVIDARTLLAEMSSAKRKKTEFDMSMSSSTSSELGYRQLSLHDTFKIVSLQSAAHPGCIIELDAISDATHDWKNTQLLHIFQEQLITGYKSPLKMHVDDESQKMGLFEPDLQAVVDLRHSSVFEEPFYLVVLEKEENGDSVLHMWRILISSQFGQDDHDPELPLIPESNLIQDDIHSTHSSRSNSPEPGNDNIHSSLHASPLQITTTKICQQILPLPSDVEVIHATPAAGHLSSSNIYPACFAPYLLCTACSDGTVRFWKCDINNKENVKADLKKDHYANKEYTWIEWEMMLNRKSSAVQVSGQPLFVSSAYSGRLACAYKCGRSFMRPSSENPENRYVNLCISIFECESTGGSEWILEDTIRLKNVVLPHKKMESSWDLAELVDVSVRNRKTVDTLRQKLTSSDDFENEHGPSLQHILSVPSYTTLQTLRHVISEQGNQCPLTQKSLVQLDWVSTEDGSHVLTVAVGSKVLLFTPVSTDIAQANVQAMKASKSASRPLLKQASSMVAPLLHAEEIRWMRIRTTHLKTADGLLPLPMQISWVRDGILVVGMDNEMHIYSQWKPICDDVESQCEEKEEVGVDSRNLKEQELLSRAQEASQLRLPATATGNLSRSTSYNILTAGVEGKKKRENQSKFTSPRDSVASLGSLPDFGIFEASRLACPVLPQYHPKQLMEMMSFGKIRRVKAILNHLVRCLSGTENIKKTYLQVPESIDRESDSESGVRSWSRSRALSMAATASPNTHSPLDPQGSISVFPEEVQLDYVEIQSIPPLPLYILLAADKETHGSTPSNIETNKSHKDYSGLFDINVTQKEESLDDILGDKLQLSARREMSHSTKTQKSTLTQFGPRQAHLLTRLLTHSHLPGLSSLDQMHLLALADTVSSFNVTFSDQFHAESDGPKQLVNKQDNAFEITTDALDDCGLRYLLAVRHHTYLMRCLPLVQRAQLQKKGLGTHSIVCAFHSETQEELLQLIPTVQRGNPRWSELKEIGIGWWIRSNTVLRRIMEKVAKAAFQFKSEPLDAALFYLAMKKKNVVWGLFRSVSDTKMTAFFQHNFSENKWRKAALKNAFALLGKQRFHHAAAFFLLAGALKDAVDVCLSKLDDFQLAMIIIRLYEGDLDSNTNSLRSLLFKEILGYDADGTNYQPSCAHPDPFLRSMAHWMLQDYNGALKTLLLSITDVGSLHPKFVSSDDMKSSGDDATANPSVFNFYLFLRTHPLVVRRQFAQIAEEKRKSDKSINKKLESNLKLTIQGKFEDAITPLERRLFFTTAHAHFRAGCPALALEVLSRLPNHVLVDSDFSPSADINSPISFSTIVNSVNNTVQTSIISNTGTSNKVEDFDWSQPISSQNVSDSALAFDWSTPLALSSTKDEEPDFRIDDGSEEEMGIEMKTHQEEEAEEENVKVEEKNNEAKLDIMAQQLKFIACLKIMMEELSTLATGFEVDGGQLRYQLYIWLESSVSALRDLCNYGSAHSTTTYTVEGSISTSMEESEITRERLGSASFRFENSDIQRERLPTLHEILLSDKLDFEAKLHKATHRKQWLKANESLIRTLLGYCSLHGAHGGGLAAVRMELILFLQELQQERSQQQLLSPLPFLTTLPLLAASVASQKIVIGDPIYHLQAMTHDILLTIMEIAMPPFMTSTSYSKVCILRDLSTSLSACIYQSLCDSDNFVVKQNNGRNLAMENFISSSVVYQNSHLLAGHIRRHRFSSGEERLAPSTQPSKWPGVHSLRALMARDKDEDSPKLHTLLCEAYIATYLSQLTYALATCDCHILYRLVSQNFTEKTWGMLFGGGAKRLLHVATAVPQITQSSTEKESPSGESGLLNSLYKQRMKLHMKLLSQLNPETSQSVIKEDRPTYREQFVSPEMSMMSCFMSKPQLSSEWNILDYDSSDSIPSDDDDLKDDDGVDDDVFGENQIDKNTTSATIKKPKMSETIEQLDPSSYSWGILRYAIVKITYHHLLSFLCIGGIEQSDLPSVSPKIHSVLKVMEKWLQVLKANMDAFGQPPPNYIPGCYIENIPKGGPALLKYKQLLELHNTPFRSHSSSLPVKRLWNYLVRQEKVQDIFIRYIFPRKLPHLQHLDEIPSQELDSTDTSISDPIKIIHKDQDSISAFCISKYKPWIIALSTPKEIQELDISVLLEPSPWLEDEAEYDILNISQSAESLPPSDYLVVHHPADKLSSGHGQGSVGGSSYNSPTGPAPSPFGPQTGRPTTMMKGHHFAGSSNPQFCQFVLERSRHMLKPIKRHKIDGVRRMCSHPVQSFYLTGSQDGSVRLWEWDRQQPLSSPRSPGAYARVTRVLFNAQGNKFGVTDGDGNLSLWQANMSCKPFFSARCHGKQASDFIFVNSSSLIATVGHSSDNKNVCIWDTLLPQGKALVISFNCHDNGGSAVLYSKQNQILITAGKKGFVCIFDIRQNQMMHSFQAHDSAIKCMTLDPIEEFFVTGAADGDIRVWGLPHCSMIYSFPGEHIRNTLFRNISMGVTHLDVDSFGRLFSCGADGSMKLRILPDRDQVVNTVY